MVHTAFDVHVHSTWHRDGHQLPPHIFGTLKLVALSAGMEMWGLINKTEMVWALQKSGVVNP